MLAIEDKFQRESLRALVELMDDFERDCAFGDPTGRQDAVIGVLVIVANFISPGERAEYEAAMDSHVYPSKWLEAAKARLAERDAAAATA